MSFDTQHIFYKPDSTKSNFIVGSIHVLYLIYSFKHGQSPLDILGKLKKCGLEDIGRFLSDLLHESSMCATK